MAADYQQTFETDSVATIFDVTPGTVSAIATDQAEAGTHSLKFHQTGSSSAAKRTLPGNQVGVHRFWLRWSATPAANEQAFVIRDPTDATSPLIFFIRSTGFLNIQASSGAGSGNANSASAPAANTWHSIDILFDSSGTSWSIQWKIDGVSQTTVTATGQTATTQGFANFCKSGANTFDWWVDDWQYGHLSADYPFADIGSGPVSGTASNLVPALGAATGTIANHLFSGTASSPVAAPGSATGVASDHVFSGIASGPTGTSGAATGVASTHAQHGIATAPVSAPGAATGVATRHLFAGTASGPTGTAGAATGVATRHLVSGVASSVVTTGQVAAGQALGGVRSSYRRRPRPSVQ